MKRMFKCLPLLIILVGIQACKKSFLEVTPNGDTYLEANYYQNAAQAFSGLVSVYDPLGSETGVTYSNKQGLLNAASDDCGAGGGSASDIPAWVVLDNFTLNSGQGPQSDLWGR